MDDSSISEIAPGYPWPVPRGNDVYLWNLARPEPTPLVDAARPHYRGYRLTVAYEPDHIPSAFADRHGYSPEERGRWYAKIAFPPNISRNTVTLWCHPEENTHVAAIVGGRRALEGYFALEDRVAARPVPPRAGG